MTSRRRRFVAALVALVACAVAAAPSSTGALDDLPLVIVPPSEVGAGRMVLLMSGDGGWQELPQTVAAALASQGFGVVGFNSLRYFWRPRTPDGTVRDVLRIVEHYGQQWRAQDLWLVGYSFGADVLPVVLNRLPADVRVRVRGLTLIAPSSYATFEIKLRAWFGGSTPGLPTVPELARLRGLPIVCLYGEADADAVCPSLPAGLATVRRLPGGHHFGGDYAAVARAVLPPESL